MSTIKYEIDFFSHWHCGSGQAAGADVDALVIKDRRELPYVPGKTIKGLLRDAAMILGGKRGTIDKVFGVPGKQNGNVYFGNATLTKAESNYIVQEKLTKYLYQSFSSTAIDGDGIAKNNSLRKIETVVPCKLEGIILNAPEDDECEKLLVDAMKFIKRMGTGRNRGFGRCSFTIVEIEKEETK